MCRAFQFLGCGFELAADEVVRQLGNPCARAEVSVNLEGRVRIQQVGIRAAAVGVHGVALIQQAQPIAQQCERVIAVAQAGCLYQRIAFAMSLPRFGCGISHYSMKKNAGSTPLESRWINRYNGKKENGCVCPHKRIENEGGIRLENRV